MPECFKRILVIVNSGSSVPYHTEHKVSCEFTITESLGDGKHFLGHESQIGLADNKHHVSCDPLAVYFVNFAEKSQAVELLTPKDHNVIILKDTVNFPFTSFVKYLNRHLQLTIICFMAKVDPAISHQSKEVDSENKHIQSMDHSCYNESYSEEETCFAKEFTWLYFIF